MVMEIYKQEICVNIVLVKAVLMIIITAGYCFHKENNQIRLFKITIEVYKKKISIDICKTKIKTTIYLL